MASHGNEQSSAAVYLLCLLLALWGCGEPAGERASPLEAKGRQQGSPPISDAGAVGASRGGNRFVGSASCRDCHERFYQLWAPSHHGLAMQPFTVALGTEQLRPLADGLEIGGMRYRVELDDRGGRVVASELGGAGATAGEQARPASGTLTYELQFALGGKNVFYFLTALERGRLQVVPVAYDLNSREWFDTTGSAVRHFPDVRDEALDWRHPAYTFNTSCFGCHVSQASTNYDPATGAYNTTWIETGINCESCHGPAGEHVRVCREAPPDRPPDDLRIILIKQFDVVQTNDLCAPCHAKAMPLALDTEPGSPFYDAFDLTVFDHGDYYPDGRDLGENYTQSSWLLSPCVKGGELDCLHCHTSSGRFRQKDDPDSACLPCHAARVHEPEPHSRHAAGTPGGRCIDCHMPATWFARMDRHDHSMRPPRPAATQAFGSPSACGTCHAERPAAWADQQVRAWHGEASQESYMRPALLVQAGRDGDWRRLDDMLAYVAAPDSEALFVASLLRLLESCPDPARWEVMREQIRHPSPLVRASAARALAGDGSRATVSALLAACQDPARLVRVRAAAALARIPGVADSDAGLRAATGELLASLQARPDDALSHYNLGNYHLGKGNVAQAIHEYETSVQLRQDLVPPLVNLSMAYAGQGRLPEAEGALRLALESEPDNAAVLFNLGLLLGEQQRAEEAVAALRAALDSDPELAAAAYNLGMILGADRPGAAVPWLERAVEIRPGEPRYRYSLAFHLRATGQTERAVGELEEQLAAHPGHADSWLLLERIYLDQGRMAEVQRLARAALDQPQAPAEIRSYFAARSGR